MRAHVRFGWVRRSLASGAVLSVLIQGCAPLQIQRQSANIRGMAAESLDQPDSTMALRLLESGRLNRTRIEQQYKEEWRLHEARTGRREYPQKCLALSGGGIRSAAFSVGVMMALEDSGGLEQFDIISAVSGGAYALSWLYTR